MINLEAYSQLSHMVEDIASCFFKEFPLISPAFTVCILPILIGTFISSLIPKPSTVMCLHSLCVPPQRGYHPELPPKQSLRQWPAFKLMEEEKRREEEKGQNKKLIVVTN